MPKVLILGCNHTQLPYIRAAAALGFEVVGTDYNVNAPGKACMDRFYPVSYIDFAGLKDVAAREKLTSADFIFTASSHLAYEGAARTASFSNIPFMDLRTVDICLNKIEFYKALQNYNIQVPPTLVFAANEIEIPDASKVYFLKSDYGKSPQYCYRLSNGEIPDLPLNFDDFYRKFFLLQEEIRGTHFRLNFYSGHVATFFKINDSAALPMRVFGPGYAEVITKLGRLINGLKLNHFLVKFDLIVIEDDWYVIDIGLDPPMRLRLLCEYAGFDFPTAYVKYYLLGDTKAIPSWDELYQPTLIQGFPESEIQYTSFDVE